MIYTKRENMKTKIVWIILGLSLCVIVFSGAKLIEIERTYAQGDQTYDSLAAQVRGTISAAQTAKPSETSQQVTRDEQGGAAGESAASAVEIPDIEIDFTALNGVNEDAVAWLYCPGTVIDYPVMRAEDYNTYLYYLPDGTYNVNGSLFFDYNNQPDFSGRLTIIYGHNMKSGKMFGSLTGYKRQSYFDENPYLYIYTETVNYRLDLIYGCLVDAGDWRDRAFVFETNLDSLLAYAAHNTTFASAVEYAEDDRFVVLSTCSYEFDDARYVVIGVLRQ